MSLSCHDMTRTCHRDKLNVLLLTCFLGWKVKQQSVNFDENFETTSRPVNKRILQQNNSSHSRKMPPTPKDVWKYWQNEPGSSKVRCRFCKSSVQNRHATRCKIHIVKCPMAPAEVKGLYGKDSVIGGGGQELYFNSSSGNSHSDSRDEYINFINGGLNSQQIKTEDEDYSGQSGSSRSRWLEEEPEFLDSGERKQLIRRAPDLRVYPPSSPVILDSGDRMSTATSATTTSTKSFKPVLLDGEVLGIIGGGEMAKAIMFPLFDAGLMDPSRVIVSGTSLKRLQPWGTYGCKTVVGNAEILKTADVVMWAVKPQMFKTVAEKAVEELGMKAQGRRAVSGQGQGKNVLHISVLAGLTLEELCQTLKVFVPSDSERVRVARVMPNIGLRVRAGAAVYTMSSKDLDPKDSEIVASLFEPNGICLEVLEPQINAFTALFGCGIGFMFPVIEAMSDGAVKMGIARDISLQLAAQTMKGAAELILQGKRHPAVLKDSVCSAGGSTIAGITELERCGVRNGFISAVEASTKRGFELGRLNQPKKD